MEEVPGSEESLLALDEQPALTGQDEEGLLIRLGVVNAALPGLEDGHIDPELRELDRRLAVLVGEPTRRAPRLRREPLGIAHVDNEPTLSDGGKPGASVLKPRFVHAADSRSPSDGCLVCASVPECTLSGKVQLAMTNPLKTQRGFWTFGVLTWALAMLVGVIGVGVILDESLGAFVFAACLLTIAVAFWLWILRRLTR
jgi:hypothetical protein